MPAAAAAVVPDEAIVDRVLAGERISQEDARALYRLPLNELGALADHRRNLATQPPAMGDREPNSRS